MDTAELCLTWDDHHNALIRVFEELLQSNSLVDCTIAAEGQYLKAHKVVLSACSPYFQMLFSQENEKNPIVVLKDMKFQELRAVIDFVYRGQVKVQDNQLEQFLEAADSLQIRGLANHQKKTTPEKVNNPAPNKRAPSPPIARKRRRTSTSQAREEEATVSQRGDDDHVNRVTSEIPVDVHVPSLPIPSSSSSIPATTVFPHASGVSRHRLRSRPPSSPEEILSDVETIIKTEPEPEPEPEPLTEVFVSETKSEELYIDDTHLVDNEVGNPDDTSVDEPSQQSTTQYSASPIFDSSDDPFLATQMAEQSGAQDMPSFRGCIPVEARRTGEKSKDGLFPKKSFDLYKKEYDALKSWMAEKKINNFRENVLLMFYGEMSEKFSPSTLWTKFSMIKKMLFILENVDVSKYKRLYAFLKNASKDYEPKKSPVLSREHILMFLKDAPNSTYLMEKVAMLLGVLGALKISELVNLKITDIEDTGSSLLINITKSENRKTRRFVVSDDSEVLGYSLIKHYMMMRPQGMERFLVGYRFGCCVAQLVGKNKIGSIPSKIARFLGLPNTKAYTGDCFRRTSATLLADAGINTVNQKLMSRWIRS